MSTVADAVDAVVGGDTHVDTISLCLMNPVGGVMDELTVGNDGEGHGAALTWILQRVPSARLVIGLEGTRSYGIGFARAAQAVGFVVVEVPRPTRAARARRGKSDALDAELAARAVLAMDVRQAPQPRADGDREALRLLSVGRDGMNRTRTAMINQLLAVLLTGDEHDQALRKTDLTVATLHSLCRRRGRAGEGTEQRVRRQELRRLAQVILQLNRDIRDNEKDIRGIVTGIAPVLLEQTGVGPVTAAQLIVSYSHHGRCRNEAAFAALAGVSPIPASSGRVQRRRLNRGGDRRLNRCLHTIAITRIRCCPRTRDFVSRHADDKTDREIRRILKRYIAREMFALLSTIDTLQAPHVSIDAPALPETGHQPR
jgi:transposase